MSIPLLPHWTRWIHMCNARWLPNYPLQLFKHLLSLQGISQSAPKSLRSALHVSVATSQYKNKWLIDSPQCLHIQHHSSTIMFLLSKLSKVKIFPRVAVHTKRATLGGVFNFSNTLPRTSGLNRSRQYLVVSLHCKCNKEFPPEEIPTVYCPITIRICEFRFYFWINNVYSNNAQKSVTHVHMEYTRDPYFEENEVHKSRTEFRFFY
jgi:hypothetical protein